MQDWSSDTKAKPITSWFDTSINLMTSYCNFYHTISNPEKGSFWKNPVRKGENVDNKHSPLYSQCFLPFLKHISIFNSHIFVVWKRVSLVQV